MTREEKALETFRNYNCCQAVVSPFCEELGLESEKAFKIASAFGGGMRRGEVCGAVTGSLMVLGLKEGQALGGPVENMDRTKALTVEFHKRFEEACGSILCRGLLGYDLSKEEDRKIIADKQLTSTICPDAIKEAVRITRELLELA